jgi:2-polyprenyl-3-methyl-5-hydroxy-6-metoxy-1,4-benzoquinol methylase
MMPHKQDAAATFEAIYRVPGEAPWTLPEPHPLVVQLVAQHTIPPGRVLEVGCGEGYHAIYLASQGFTVVAIDRSRKAIQYAQDHAREAKVAIEFLVMASQDLPSFDRQFDFVFDWRFFHEMTDEDERRAYIRNVAHLLVPGGKYLSVAFSGESNYWGAGTLRTAPNTHMVLYFARWEDLQRLCSPYFTVLERKTISVLDKPDCHVPAYCIFLEKK